MQVWISGCFLTLVCISYPILKWHQLKKLLFNIYFHKLWSRKKKKLQRHIKSCIIIQYVKSKFRWTQNMTFLQCPKSKVKKNPFIYVFMQTRDLRMLFSQQTKRLAFKNNKHPFIHFSKNILKDRSLRFLVFISVNENCKSHLYKSYSLIKSRLLY